jgi:hypothetical protein
VNRTSKNGIVLSSFCTSKDEEDEEDPGLRIESFAVINLCGVSTNKTIIYKHIIINFLDYFAYLNY